LLRGIYFPVGPENPFRKPHLSASWLCRREHDRSLSHRRLRAKPRPVMQNNTRSCK
jgi:hypothetical protein